MPAESAFSSEERSERWARPNRSALESARYMGDNTVTNKTTSTAATKSGIRIKSRVKAGAITLNHNQTVKGMRVKSRVKAGITVTRSLDASTTN
jgi:hypothetical protein